MDSIAGISVFEPQSYVEVVGDSAGRIPLLMEFLREGKYPGVTDEHFAVKYWLPAASNAVIEQGIRLVTLSRDIPEDAASKRYVFGLIAWPGRDEITSEYFGTMPTELHELIGMASSCGIDLSEALRFYIDSGLQLYAGIPVTIAIRRPTKLIGREYNVEFLTFAVSGNREAQDPDQPSGLKPDAKVFMLGNRVPITPTRSAELSNVDPLPTPIVVVGVGAVGSKLSMHFARAGDTNMLLIDNDALAPHNLVRHALSARWLGNNKAQSVSLEVKELFSQAEVLQTRFDDRSALDVLTDEFPEAGVLIDCSASPSVMRFLTERETKGARVARCELGWDGRLGLLLIEGSDGNPRVDDLMTVLFDASLYDPDISAWLVSHRANAGADPRLEEIDIGLGCSSNTMRLADDLVSYHTAAFARGLRDRIHQPVGQLQVSSWDGACSVGGIRRYTVQPLLVRPARNDSEWEIRICQPAAEVMRSELKRCRPSETGGLLFGRIRPERKVLHVTRALAAPTDSGATEWAFRRGVRDVPETVDRITYLSGGQITYVGEWHTHPKGGTAPSPTDLIAAGEIRASLDRAGILTHLLVVTPRALSSYLFGPGTKSN